MNKLDSEKENLPKGWIKVPIGQIVLLINGKAFKPEDWTDEGLPIVRIQNLNNHGKSFNHCSFEVDKKFLIDDGQLLFAWSGTPGTSFGSFIWNRGKAVLNQHIYKININEKYLEKQYLLYSINQNLGKYINKSHGTAGLAHITKGKFEEELIILPPHLEQKRIVSKIESIFTQIDAAKESLVKIKVLIKQARQSVLKSAFEGTLVPQDPKDESAEILLRRIHRGSNKKLMFETNFLNNWINVSLDQILEPSKQKFDPEKEINQPYIGLEHMGKNSGQIIGKENSKDTRSIKNIFKNGDILYGRLRPYLNKVAVADFNGVCSTDILVFSRNNNLDSKYIALFLLSNQFVQFATMNMTGVQHPRIKFEKFSQFLIPLAPLNEQKRIVSKIESIFGKIDAIEKQVDFALNRLDSLKKSVLKKAFEGKLVPQDPNDEPVSILLEKIKSKKPKK